MLKRYTVVCATCLYQSFHSSRWEADIYAAAHLRDNPTHSATVVEEGQRVNPGNACEARHGASGPSSAGPRPTSARKRSRERRAGADARGLHDPGGFGIILRIEPDHDEPIVGAGRES